MLKKGEVTNWVVMPCLAMPCQNLELRIRLSYFRKVWSLELRDRKEQEILAKKSPLATPSLAR